MSLLLVLGLFGCNNDSPVPDENKPEPEKELSKNGQEIEVVGDKICDVQGIEGIIKYNSKYNLWYISIIPPIITYDSTLDYYPLHLDDEFRVVSKKVVFSGDVFQMNLPFAVPAGAEYYAIELTSLKFKP